jgi:hypothetical protein
VSSYDDFDEEVSAPRSSERAPNRKPCESKPAAVQASAVQASAAQGNLVKTSPERLEKTKVQPAETEPRAPHKAPATQPAGHSAPPRNSGFGAGIW